MMNILLFIYIYINQNLNYTLCMAFISSALPFFANINLISILYTKKKNLERKKESKLQIIQILSNINRPIKNILSKYINETKI